MTPRSCPSCDSQKPAEVISDWVKQIYKGRTFTVHAEITKCQDCGFSYLTDQQTDALHQKAKAFAKQP